MSDFEHYDFFYDSDEWREARDLVIQRDRGKCRVCDNVTALTAHHTRYAFGGAADTPVQALVTLCDVCHFMEHRVVGSRGRAVRGLVFHLKSKRDLTWFFQAITYILARDSEWGMKFHIVWRKTQMPSAQRHDEMFKGFPHVVDSLEEKTAKTRHWPGGLNLTES